MAKRKPQKKDSEPAGGMPPIGDIGGDALNRRDQATGRFLPGNRFWEARSSAGPKPKFANGEQLWAACVEYFQWVDENPLWEDHLVTFQGSAKHEPMAKMRAMTVKGLCLFLDVDYTTWVEWRSSRPDLSNVLTRAESVIYSQKFAGAAAELLNANIIARDLGLTDKAELTGKDGKDLIPDRPVTPFEMARYMAFVLEQAATAPKPNGHAPNGVDQQ